MSKTLTYIMLALVLGIVLVFGFRSWRAQASVVFTDPSLPQVSIVADGLASAQVRAVCGENDVYAGIRAFLRSNIQCESVHVQNEARIEAYQGGLRTKARAETFAMRDIVVVGEKLADLYCNLGVVNQSSQSNPCPSSPLAGNIQDNLHPASVLCYEQQYPCSGFQEWDEYICGCGDPWPTMNSPIIVDIAGDGFKLTPAQGGVYFNLDDQQPVPMTSWTAAGVDDAFLVLDRDGDNAITTGRELFGDRTQQPPSDTQHGFLALAEFDKGKNGGNGDSKIDVKDSIFSALRLWQDKNHDGISQPRELHPLVKLGVTGFDLDFKESKKIDEYGNLFRYRAKVYGETTGRWAWDIFLRKPKVPLRKTE